MNQTITKIVAFAAIAGMTAMPLTASAQSHRKKTQSDWQKAAYASGAVSALGFLTKNSPIGWLGLGGAAYSSWRSEEDRKSAQRHHVYALHRRHHRPA